MPRCYLNRAGLDVGPDACGDCPPMRRGERSLAPFQQHWSLDMLAQDLRYGWRMLRRNPGFTCVATLTLALGIGATTAIFSIANAVLWRGLPYRDAASLVQLWETNPDRNWTDAECAPANVADWRRENRSFQDLAAYFGAARDAW